MCVSETVVNVIKTGSDAGIVYASVDVHTQDSSKTLTYILQHVQSRRYNHVGRNPISSSLTDGHNESHQCPHETSLHHTLNHRPRLPVFTGKRYPVTGARVATRGGSHGGGGSAAGYFESTKRCGAEPNGPGEYLFTRLQQGKRGNGETGRWGNGGGEVVRDRSRRGGRLCKADEEHA